MNESKTGEVNCIHLNAKSKQEVSPFLPDHTSA